MRASTRPVVAGGITRPARLRRGAPRLTPRGLGSSPTAQVNAARRAIISRRHSLTPAFTPGPFKPRWELGALALYA
jgi:hypothetical protein